MHWTLPALWLTAAPILAAELPGKLVVQRVTPSVNAVAADPKGRYLAVGTDDGIEIWDARSENLIATQPGRHCVSVNFSPDGDRLVSVEKQSRGPSPATVQIRAVRESGLGAPTTLGSVNNATLVAAGFMTDGRQVWIERFQTDVTAGQNARAFTLLDATTGKILSDQTENVRRQKLPPVEAAKAPVQLVEVREGDNYALQVVESGKAKFQVPLPDWNVERKKRWVIPDAACLSADGKRLAVAWPLGEQRSTLRTFDLDARRMLASVETDGPVTSVAFYPDGRRLLVGQIQGTYDVKVGGLFVMEELDRPALRKNPQFGFVDTLATVRFSPDGNSLVAASQHGGIYVWDVPSLTLRGMSLLPKGGLGTEFGGCEMLFDARNCCWLRHGDPGAGNRLIPHDEWIFDLAACRRLGQVFKDKVHWIDEKSPLAQGPRKFVPAQKQNASAAQTRFLSTKNLSPNDARVALHPKGVLVAYLRADGSIGLRNAENGHEVALLTVADAESEWAIFSDDGYFDASANGAHLLGITLGLRSYDIDQFALERNRPDILLARLGLLKDAQRKVLEGAVKLRLAQQGPDSVRLDGSEPSVMLSRIEQSGPQAVVEFEVAAGSAPVSRFEMFANDSILEVGTTGLRQLGPNRHRATFPLIPGANKIEIAAIDGKQRTSPRTKAVLHAGAPRAGRVLFAGVAVTQYADDRFNLNFTTKDAREMEVAFRAIGQRLEGFESKLLLDAQATSAGTKTLRTFFQTSRPNDLVVLFISGHGAYLDSPEGLQYFFLTHEADPNSFAKTCLSYAEIEKLLTDIPARRKLVLLDTCQSGVRVLLDSVNAALLARLGLGADSAIAPADVIFPALPHRSRFVSRDLFRRTGAVVFSASAGSENAVEDTELKNGLFTHALKQALSDARADANSDGSLSVSEMRAFVAARVRERTEGAQNPTIDRDNLFQHFALPLAARDVPADSPPATLQNIFDAPIASRLPPDSLTEFVQRAKAVLRRAGLYAGELDGAPGKPVDSAIRKWQRQQGIRATGRLDMPTLSSMGLAFDALEWAERARPQR